MADKKTELTLLDSLISKIGTKWEEMKKSWSSPTKSTPKIPTGTTNLPYSILPKKIADKMKEISDQN